MATDMVGNYLKKKAYGGTATKDLQVIPARHGTATFVPAGSSIKIINTSGTQVVDTWAFALPNPPETEEKQAQAVQEEEKKPAETPKPTPKKGGKKGKDLDLPSQEDAEKATAGGLPADEAEAKKKKGGWSSYLPSMSGGKPNAQQKENSRTWGQYFEAGQGFTSYIPTRDQLSKFTEQHSRDKNKPYIQQLTDFSRTPVGAAGISALSGSGYASSLYAGYSAWSGASAGAQGAPPMEYLSLPHTRTATGHMVPKLYDTLVSNLREPIMTLLEDSGPGVHDTLIAACDPQRYKMLGVEKWEEHDSCAQNLVMALKELNDKAGLKGPKGIGANITLDSVPSPLNLFMNIPWDDKGDISFQPPAGGEGDYVRFKAERDIVVVMSACPNDIQKINADKSTDAHFVVEEDNEDEDEAGVRARLSQIEKEKENPKPQRPAARPRTATPKKLNGTAQAPSASKAAAAKSTSSAPSSGDSPAAKKPSAPSSAPAAKKSPVGQTKQAPKPSTSVNKTPVGQKKTPAGGSQKAAPKPAEGKKDESKDELKSLPPQAEDSSPAPSSSAAAPAQKKKPRKLGASRGTSVQAPSTAGGD